MSFKSKTVIGPRKKNPLPVGNKALSCGSVTPRNNPLLRKVNSSREFSIKELKEGNINAINKYIRASNDVNKSFENGKRLIHFASKNGEIQSVELLIYSGSNLNATDANGCTALDCVRHKKGCSNFIEIATLLVMHGGWTWGITKNEEISIDADVITGNIEAVKQYIADGNNINKLFNYTTSTKHKCGLNLLHLAFNGGHKEIAQLLISNGVDLEAHNADGKRLIHNAAEKGDKQFVELLICSGANVNTSRTSPLHTAAICGHKEIVELLIANGAALNAKNKRGKTPLDKANGDIVDLLRKHGGKTGGELKAE